MHAIPCGIVSIRESRAEGITMILSRADEEIIEFIASGTSPGDVAAFLPSQTTKQRVADLLTREKTSGLTPDEALELDHYQQLEHLMRLAKAKARRHLAHE